MIGTIILLILGLIFISRMHIPIEKVHIFEYGVLGWLAARDLIKKNRKLNGFILACLFGGFVGIIDELFQGILPYRVYDIRDIGFNFIGSSWGTTLYLLNKK